MPANFLISGTDTRVGKTTVGCALAFAFRVQRMRVGVMQPVATGSAESGGVRIASGAVLLANESSNLPMDLVAAYRYRSSLAPAVAADGGSGIPDFELICRNYRQIATQSDATLVEERGGLGAPIDWRHNFTDLALELKLEAFLIVANRGDFINAAALTIEYAKRRQMPVRDFIECDKSFFKTLAGVPC
jgi:dethiobiotin synthetase